jgi:hypothetical protein
LNPGWFTLGLRPMPVTRSATPKRCKWEREQYGRHVGMDGAQADHNAPGDHLVSRFDRNQLNYLHLALCQPGRSDADSLCRRARALQGCSLVCARSSMRHIDIGDGTMA